MGPGTRPSKKTGISTFRWPPCGPMRTMSSGGSGPERPLWGDALEDSFRQGHVIFGAVAQAKWRADEVDMWLREREQGEFLIEPSKWSWAIHCKEIEEEAFSS